MSAGVERFRRLACGLPGVEESAHMGNPDFRVGGRIFATLSGQARGRGVLKLTVEQQAAFVAELPEVFEPVQGGWGRMGMTYIVLDRADDATMSGALVTAHRNVESKAAAKKTAKPGAKAAKKRAR
jgi:YjbR